MDCTACTEPQCLYKGVLYIYIYISVYIPKCTDMDRIDFSMHLAPYLVSESKLRVSAFPPT